jgi:hypothetical protein
MQYSYEEKRTAQEAKKIRLVEIWTNGEQKLPIPRHSEVNELTAKAILKTAKSNLGRK